MYKDANVASGLLPYDGTIADSTKRLAGLPLLFNPGEKWEYSLGVDVLGRLVEVVSGKPLDEFFRTRIFEPLGMKDSYFYPPENKLERLATAYTYYEGKGLNPLSRHSDHGRLFHILGRLPGAWTEEAVFWWRRTGVDGGRLPSLLPDDA